MKKEKVLLGLLAGFALSGFFAVNLRAEEAPRMAKEELKEILGKPGVVVIDVRAKADWMDSKQKIKGAVREDPKKVASWMGKYPKDGTFVFYCS
jgi:hypothetical protein